MANVKISNFSEQDDVSLIEGFAGYQGTASKSNIRISGNKLKLWLQNNLDFATAAGTTNYLAKFTSTGTLGDSLIRDDGTYVGIFAAPKANSGVFIDFREVQTLDRAVEVDSLGEFGITSRAYNSGTGSPVDKIGVFGQALDSEDQNIGVKGFANAVNSTLGSSYAIGGAFQASNGDFTYSLQLEDGTEGVGKFLKSVTADGHANWSALPITVTSLTLTDGPTSTGDGLSLTSNASGDYTLSMHAYGGDTFKGFVPTGGSSSTFLRGDGTWVTPTNTNYTAGDGLTLTGTTFSTDLKTNGGLVIESAKLAVDLSASAITGTLASDDGGTGFSSYTKGDLLVCGVGNVLSILSIGSTNEVLKVDASGVPVWAAEGGYTLPAATTSALGGIQLNVAASATPIAPNLPSSTAGRYYAVQIDSTNKAFVNIPWTDNNSTYGITTAQSASGSNSDPYLRLVEAGTANVSDIKMDGTGPITITRDSSFPSTYIQWDINSFTGSAKGAVPSASVGDAGKFLKADGSWDTPTNTGLTSVGLVMPSAFSVTNSPLTSNGDITVAPLNATNGQYLDYLGEWSTPPNTTYTAGQGISIVGTTISVATTGTVEVGDLKVDLDSSNDIKLDAEKDIELTATGSTTGIKLSSDKMATVEAKEAISLNIKATATGATPINAQPRLGGAMVVHGDTTGGGAYDGSITLNCSPPHSAAATYTLVLPTSAGSNTEVLQTDGNGNLSWATNGGGGSGGGFPGTVSATSSNTSTAVDTLYIVTTSALNSDVVMTLPTAASNSGKIIGVKYAAQNDANDTVVIKTISSQTIDGTNRTTNGLPLASVHTYYELVSDGSNWWIK